MMAIKQVTTYICDRCAKESPRKVFVAPSQEGSFEITYKGTLRCKPQGSKYGAPEHKYSGESLLCVACSEDFLKFINVKE